MEKQKLIPVDIVALIEDEVSASPIIILHDRAGNRLLPIWIGDAEARSIAIALNNMKMPRPLTHTLFLRTVSQMGGRLSRIVVDGIKNHTYYAKIYVQAVDKLIEIDSRPSDALALALEARAPIFVDSAVMNEAGQTNPFPGMAMRQEMRKEDLAGDNLKRLKELLDRARERERQSSQQ